MRSVEVVKLEHPEHSSFQELQYMYTDAGLQRRFSYSGRDRKD